MKTDRAENIIRKKITELEVSDNVAVADTDELWRRLQPMISPVPARKISWTYYKAAAAILLMAAGSIALLPHGGGSKNMVSAKMAAPGAKVQTVHEIKEPPVANAPVQQLAIESKRPLKNTEQYETKNATKNNCASVEDAGEEYEADADPEDPATFGLYATTEITNTNLTDPSAIAY